MNAQCVFETMIFRTGQRPIRHNDLQTQPRAMCNKVTSQTARKKDQSGQVFDATLSRRIQNTNAEDIDNSTDSYPAPKHIRPDSICIYNRTYRQSYKRKTDHKYVGLG